MLDLLKMFLLAAGAAYLVLRIGCLLQSLVRVRRLRVSRGEASEDLKSRDLDVPVGGSDDPDACP